MIAKTNLSGNIANFQIISGILFGLFVAVFFQFFGILNLLVLVTALTLLFIMSQSPFYGLCLLLFSIPFSGILQVNRDTIFFDTANKMLAYIVALAFFFYLIRNKRTKKIEVSKSLIWFSLFSFWCIVSLLWTFDKTESLNAIFGRINLLGMAFLVALIPEGFKQFKTLCLWTTAGAGFLGTYVAFFKIENLAGDYGQRLAVGTNENVLAHGLAIGLLLSVFGFRNSGKFTKFLILVFDVFILYAIVLTGSRGTWVALIFSGILAPLFFPGIEIRKRVGFSCFAAVVGSLFYFGITHNVFGYHVREVFDRFYMISPEAAGGRINTIWPYYWRHFLENPILGSGLGFRHSIAYSPHNDFLAVLSEFGLIGFFFFAIMQVMFFLDTIAVKDSWIRLVAFTLPVFLLVAGITHTTFGLKSYALTIGLFSFLGRKMDNSALQE